jgi:hypothetical protein
VLGAIERDQHPIIQTPERRQPIRRLGHRHRLQEHQSGADPFQFHQQLFQRFHATVESRVDSQTQVVPQPRVNGSHSRSRKCDSAALRTAVALADIFGYRLRRGNL